MFLDSISTWFCDGTSGKFGYLTTKGFVKTIEPDRSKCIHQWISDVEEQVIILTVQYRV